MKNDHPVITLLGSNSGNNVGDAAILSSILETLSKEMPGVEFLVPTAKPEFINQQYGSRYRVRALDIMPWTGSLRFLGIPTLRCLARSDAALICDGIIFGKKLFNPSFNMLITLAPLVPFAKALNCKLVCYSTGIGPFPDNRGAKLARYLIENCDLIMMRERDSVELCKKIGVTKPIELTGDAAFINPVSSDERALEITRALSLDPHKKYLGINVTSYLDGWLEKENQLGDRDSFVTLVANGVRLAQQQLHQDFEPLIFSTHPMDLPPARELAAALNTKVVANDAYLSHDLQAMMRRCELFLGMRFHSVVLAQSVYTPVVALIYAPKVRGYMRLVGCEEFALEFGGLTAQKIADTLVKAWQRRSELRAQQRPIIDELKQGAERAAQLVKERCFESATKTAVAAKAA